MTDNFNKHILLIFILIVISNRAIINLEGNIREVIPMNRDQFAGKWHELKGKVKQKWGKITDDDITQINGKFEQLMGKLQHKYGWSKEQAEREINSWCASCESELRGHKMQTEQWDREQSQWREGEEEQEPHKHKSPDMKDKKRKAG